MRGSHTYWWWKWTRELVLEFLLTAFNVTFFCTCVWTGEAIAIRYWYGWDALCGIIGFCVAMAYMTLLTWGRIGQVYETHRRIKAQRKKRRERRRKELRKKRAPAPRSAA